MNQDVGPHQTLAVEGSGTMLPFTSLSLSSALPGDKRHQGLFFLESWFLESSCRLDPFSGNH